MDANGNGKNRLELPQEHHDPQYTGTWLPAKIMKLLWKGKLNPRDVILLATIESLVRLDDDGEIDLGCYASNEYLAKMIGVSRAASVSEIVSKLITMGLVKQTHFDGRKRFLITCWSGKKIKQTGG